VLVANKVDLYADSLPEAQERYVNPKSEVVKELNELVENIGCINIRWTAFYACCRLEAFYWNKQRHMLNKVDENVRDKMVSDLIDSITGYCQG